MRPPTPRPKGSVQGLAPLLKETDDLNDLKPGERALFAQKRGVR